MRVRVMAVAALGVWAATAQAGEIANWYWPHGDIPQEVGEIPVLMDVPRWVRVVDLDELAIHLVPRTPYIYEGCVDITLEARGNLNVSAKFTPTGAVPGKYSSSLSVSDVDSAGVTVRSCVEVEVESLPPLNTNVRVGTVTLKISPRP